MLWRILLVDDPDYEPVEIPLVQGTNVSHTGNRCSVGGLLLKLC